MSPLGQYLRTRGVKDGFLKGQRVWAVLGGLAWIIRLVVRMGSRRPEIVAREVLQPGQSITISSVERNET
jgi:hypothetical protein